MDTFAEALAALLGRLASIEGPLVVVVSRILVVLAAVGLASVGYRAGSRLIDKLLRPLEGASDYPVKVQRARTLGPLMKSVTRYALAFMALMVALREVGVDIRALLVSAGVLGLAVGLGAQSLIKDVITGFFILFEGLIAVGDVIEVGSHVGTVESIGLRVTKLRMLNGAQRVIPNGELTQFANYNKGWARAVLDVTVAYDVDVRRALELLERLAREWGRETGLALEDPQAQGIVRFGDGELGLRLMVKVPADKRAEAEMELRRRIKETFDREGIQVPSAERVVYLRAEKPGRQ
ncbi:MAG: mechanosensitive ion channel family protein [Candidatus Rokubacteria bacterium]|nr:mechanosensitive ion channel family protein [Candidatus Rokubacteria bacterium]MBI2199794.1 mechanosensitive ion channel family protein [Candidatus Rokubacteria bacterium]